MAPLVSRALFWSLVFLGAAIVRAQTPPNVDGHLDSAGSSIRSGASAQARDLLEPLISDLSRMRDTLHLVRALNYLARASYDLGDPASSLRHSQRVVELGTKAKTFDAVGSALMFQAIVADQVSPPDTVKSLYERALRYYLLAGDTAACAVVYDNLGFYPLLHGDIPGAIALSAKGLSCLRDTSHGNYHRSASIIESSLCNYRTWSGDARGGIAHGLRSVRHAEQSGDLPQLVHSITQLADAYVQMRDYHHALPLLLRSDSIARARSMPLNKRRDIPELLSTVYEELGDPSSALRYYKQRSALHDSLRNDVTRKEIERMERHQQHVADSLLQVEALKIQEIGNQKTLAEERGQRNMIAALAAVVGILAVSIWSRLRLTRLKNAEILRAQEQLVISEKAREAEEVRTRIARDIHDEIGSELTRITILGSNAKRDLHGDPAFLGATIDDLRSLSKQVGASLADIVWAVDPRYDSLRSLVEHARLYAQRMLDGTGIEAELRFEHDGADRSIDPARKRDLFLILKEALNNMVKHARASHAEVVLRTSADRFELRVMDNGAGFEQATDGRVNGLTNMRKRAERLSARCEIRSAPGEGTTVSVYGELV